MPSNPSPQARACVLCGPLLTPIVRESSFWRTALNQNQNLLGKLIIVLRRHEEDVTRIAPEEWTELLDELGWAVARLRDAFAPDHFNYAFLQNQDRHAHLHVIPRYANHRAFAGVDFADPDYPDMFRVPVRTRVASADVLAAMARALRTPEPG
jgi:diadenosine tetraphosphate (Ap4A) HIT family hydrolase